MKLFLDSQRRQLANNGEWNATRPETPADFRPVVKLFCPWNGMTWLLTELDPEDNDIAFGLCDLGMGEPEIGSVRLSEIMALRGPAGLRIERDRHWTARMSLSEYAAKAREAGGIYV